VRPLVEPCETFLRIFRIILRLQITFKIQEIKKSRKDVASFAKLDAAQMKKIKGGTWIEIPGSGGTTTTVWV